MTCGNCKQDSEGDMSILEEHKREVWYCWKERALDENGNPRLLTPWSNPREYEFPMDWLFKTEAEARRAKTEVAPNENWVLCRRTLETVEDSTNERR